MEAATLLDQHPATASRKLAPISSPTVPSANALLSALSAADLEALGPHLRPVSLKLGDVLFEPGDEIIYLHFPLTGAISLVLPLMDGGVVETAMVGHEGLTDATAYADPHRASVRAIVQLPGDALRVDAPKLRELAAASPSLRASLEAYAARRIRELEQAVACNAMHRLEQRLAKWLLRSHDRSDGDALPLTQEFLSEMLGAQRTTVTQVASDLQRSGAIEYRRGRITVRDRSLLKRLSCECYAASGSGAPLSA